MNNINKNTENFFKPLLSTLGLIITFIIAILPLFTETKLNEYFINKNLAYPASLIATVLGIIITWNVISFYPYMQVNLGKFKKRDKDYEEYWAILYPKHIIWLSIIIEIILFYIFFIFPNNSNFFAVLQAIIYILFFDLLIFLFALLVSNTKSQFDYYDKKDKLPENIFRTLEKNKLINPGISIFENQLVRIKEFENLDIRHIGMARKVKLQTVVQEKETIEVILSEDGTELLKIIKKHKE